MIESRRRLFISLLVLLAAAPEASPQAGSSSPPGVVGKIGKTGSGRSSPVLNVTAESSPVLCFQPGVGWQRFPMGLANGSGAGDASGPPAAANPAANPPAVAARLLSAKQAQSAECAGILPDKQELRAGAGTLSILTPNRDIRSGASAKSGAVTSFQVNSALHPNGSAGLNSIRIMPGTMPSASTHFASEAEPDEYSDQLDGRAFHAYISPIKLRRLIRNAPDYRTRKKLQQLKPATRLHRAKLDTKTTQPAGLLTPGQLARATSLRRSGANDRPRGNPQD
jgi:hypothetical protein